MMTFVVEKSGKVLDQRHWFSPAGALLRILPDGNVSAADIMTVNWGSISWKDTSAYVFGLGSVDEISNSNPPISKGTVCLATTDGPEPTVAVLVDLRLLPKNSAEAEQFKDEIFDLVAMLDQNATLDEIQEIGASISFEIDKACAATKPASEIH